MDFQYLFWLIFKKKYFLIIVVIWIYIKNLDEGAMLWKYVM